MCLARESRPRAYDSEILSSLSAPRQTVELESGVLFLELPTESAAHQASVGAKVRGVQKGGGMSEHSEYQEYTNAIFAKDKRIAETAPGTTAAWWTTAKPEGFTATARTKITPASLYLTAKSVGGTFEQKRKNGPRESK